MLVRCHDDPVEVDCSELESLVRMPFHIAPVAFVFLLLLAREF